MKRADLLTLVVLALWVAWFVNMLAFLAVNDDRILAKVVFGNDITAWRAVTTVMAYATMALGFLALAFTVVLGESKPDG